MSAVATAIVGGAVIGGIASNSAAKKGANATKNATDATIAEQQREYDLSRGDLAPYRQIGTGALNQLASLYGIPQYQSPGAASPSSPSSTAPPGTYQVGTDGAVTIPGGNQANWLSASPPSPSAPAASGTPDYSSFFSSPDYAYALQQGQQAISRQAAASGGRLSGNSLLALNQNAQGLASQNYGNYVGRLQSLAGIGQSATNTGVQAGQNAANNIGAAYQNQGNVLAGIYGNNASGINSSLQGGLSNYLTYRYMNPSPPSSSFNDAAAWG